MSKAADIPRIMKAAVAGRYGGPGVLRILEIPVPDPGRGQILVRIRAIGLNFADVIGRWGVYPGIPKPPFVPGIEFSGTVAGHGPHVSRFRIGDRVMGYSRIGSHAEYVAVDESMVGPVPEDVDFETAAAFPVASMTAYHGLHSLGRLGSGETVLIHSAAGGVGTAAVQFARHLGATVIGTAGTDEKVALVRKLGGDLVLNYRRSDFSKEVRSFRGERGVDVVFDSVGGPVFRKSWALLSGMGRYILYGLSSVSGPGSLSRLRAIGVFARMGIILPSSLISSNRSLTGFNIATLTGRESYMRTAADAIQDLLRRGVFRPVIGRRYSFEQIAAAHRDLQEGRTMGKVIIRVPAEE